MCKTHYFLIDVSNLRLSGEWGIAGEREQLDQWERRGDVSVGGGGGHNGLYDNHSGSVAALGSLFSDRFPLCSSSIVVSVRVIVWFVQPTVL